MKERDNERIWDDGKRETKFKSEEECLDDVRLKRRQKPNDRQLRTSRRENLKFCDSFNLSRVLTRG
jgi:hypothetical protein